MFYGVRRQRRRNPVEASGVGERDRVCGKKVRGGVPKEENEANAREGNGTMFSNC